jgi:uncharacterized protein (TIGR03382 family)
MITSKWSYFAGASILAAYFLLSNGAPPLAVLAGLGGAAMFTRRKSRAA